MAKTTLAQLTSRNLSGARTGQAIGDALPKPHTPAQTIGVFILGLILLAAILAAGIWFTRRDD